MQHSECSSAGDVGRLQDSLETRVSFGAAKSHNVCCSSRACSATAGAAGFGDVGNALPMSTLCSLCTCVITAAPCCCCWLHCCCCFAFCSCRDLLQSTGVPTSAIDVAVVNSSVFLCIIIRMCCCLHRLCCRDLLQRTGVPTSAIGVVVVNSSVFCPTNVCAALLLRVLVFCCRRDLLMRTGVPTIAIRLAMVNSSVFACASPPLIALHYVASCTGP